MNITSAQYTLGQDGVTNEAMRIVVNDKTLFIPLDPANRHYVEVMRQVEAGTLTIQAAE